MRLLGRDFFFLSFSIKVDLWNEKINPTMVSYFNYMLRDKLLEGCKQVYSYLHHEIISILVSAKKEGVKLLFICTRSRAVDPVCPTRAAYTQLGQTLPLTVKNWKLTQCNENIDKAIGLITGLPSSVRVDVFIITIDI